MLDLRAAVAERAFGLAQCGNQESLAVRGEPVDHLIEVRAALPDRLQRDDDERLRVESDDADQVVVLESLGDGLGGGLGVGEFVVAAHRARLVDNQNERAFLFLVLRRLHRHRHHRRERTVGVTAEAEARIAADHRERTAATHVRTIAFCAAGAIRSLGTLLISTAS